MQTPAAAEIMEWPEPSGRGGRDHAPSIAVRLTDAPLGCTVELVHIELPDGQAEPLLERGLLPGCRLSRVRNSPAGDPIISVEGTLLALRCETARQLLVRESAPANGTSPRAAQRPGAGRP